MLLRERLSKNVDRIIHGRSQACRRLRHVRFSLATIVLKRGSARRGSRNGSELSLILKGLVFRTLARGKVSAF
jgi:hypothetical protein